MLQDRRRTSLRKRRRSAHAPGRSPRLGKELAAISATRPPRVRSLQRRGGPPCGGASLHRDWPRPPFKCENVARTSPKVLDMVVRGHSKSTPVQGGRPGGQRFTATVRKGVDGGDCQARKGLWVHEGCSRIHRCLDAAGHVGRPDGHCDPLDESRASSVRRVANAVRRRDEDRGAPERRRLHRLLRRVPGIDHVHAQWNPVLRHRSGRPT